MDRTGEPNWNGNESTGRIGFGFPRKELWLPLILLIVALGAGGASMYQPLRDMAVQFVAVILLAASLSGFNGQGFSPGARAPLMLACALAALMIFQLIPLPVSIWSGLGGRAMSVEVLDLIGLAGRARPLSLDPERTIASALALLPGVAMAIAVMRVSPPSRLLLAWGVVACAMISLLLGILQVTSASPQTLTLYRTAHLGQPIGVFANTNHQADLLAIGIILAGALVPPRGLSGQGWVDKPWWIYGVMAALAAGVVASGSRGGIAVLGIGLMAIALREQLRGHVRIFLGSAATLGIGLVLLVLFNPVFARSFADFSDLDDPRFGFWPNIVWAIGEFGWLGTGAGTFDGVYRSAETLETLSSHFLNHAHNDYLEIILEMGVPGAILLLAFVIFILFRGVAIVRQGTARIDRNLAYGALVCLVMLMLHSAVDYPLRTPLLSTIFGLCVGLITPAPIASSLRVRTVPDAEGMADDDTTKSTLRLETRSRWFTKGTGS